MKYISVAHRRANGQVEQANGMILDGLKKILYGKNSKKGGKWIHELPSVVYGLHTQPSKAIGQSPFFLVYGSEAILPTDVMWQSPCLEMYEEGESDEAGHWSLTQQRRSDEMPYYRRPTSGVTMTTTFRRDL